MIDKILLVTQEGLDAIWCELRANPPGLSQLAHGVGDYLRIAQQFDFTSEDEGSMWVPTGRFWVTLTHAQRKHISRQAERDSYAAKFEIVQSYRS